MTLPFLQSGTPGPNLYLILEYCWLNSISDSFLKRSNTYLCQKVAFNGALSGQVFLGSYKSLAEYSNSQTGSSPPLTNVSM